MGCWIGNLGLIMKKLILFLLLLLPLMSWGANPAFQDFYGTNGILIRTNGNKVQIDGSMLTNGGSAVYFTTNLFAQNIYVTNLFATNIITENLTVTSNLFVSVEYVTNLFSVFQFTSNLYVTNIVVDQFISTSNFYTINNYSSNIVTTNIFVNQTLVTSNIYVTNLFVGTIIGKDIIWTNDNGTIHPIDQSNIGIGTNSADALFVLANGTNAINILRGDQLTVPVFMVASNGDTYGQMIVSEANGIEMWTTNSATTFAYTLSLKKRGTTGDKTAAITLGSEIGNLNWKGWDGSTYGSGASIVVKSDQDFSGSAYGSHMEFRLVATNQTSGTELMRLVFLNPTNAMVELNGTSASFPALKRFGQDIQIRLADNSGYGGFTSSNATFAGSVFVTNNIGIINGVAYTWPGSQGSAQAVLTNNGSGTMGWWVPNFSTAGFAALEVDTNGVRMGLVTNINFTAGVTGSVSGSTVTIGVNSAGVSLGMLQTNIFTTNVQGSPVVGALWLQGTTGTAPTNGARSVLEYVGGGYLRIGAVAGNGAAGVIRSSTSTYSNYWDSTNIGAMTFVLGSNNLARADYSSIMGGRQNVIETNAFLSFIGGGAQNYIVSNAANSVIVGGTNNYILGSNQVNALVGNFIGGGGDNGIRGAGTQFATVVGGFANIIGQANNSQNNFQYSFIGGGQGNQAFGAYCTISGGNANVVSSFTTTFPNYATISGGNANAIAAASAASGTGSTIGGGENNAIGNSGSGGGAKDATISGGLGNFIDGDGGNAPLSSGVIAGGAGNSIGLNDYNAVISGGKSNVINASMDAAFILGGVSNKVTAADAGVVGYWTTNSTASTVAIGVFDTNKVTVDSLGLKVEGFSRTKAGKSTTYASLGGTISVNVTAVENAGTAETNLMTYAVPANALTNTNDRLIIRASGKYAPTANAKQIKLILGSETLYDSTSQIQNGGTWVIEAEIIRTGTTAQTYNTDYHGSGLTLFALSSVGTTTQTNGIATTLKLTATAGATSDITNNTMTIEWRYAP